MSKLNPFELTKEQEDDVVARIRRNREILFAHGGRRCHCGGLVYPDVGEGERYTCTHGGTPLTRAEIAAYFARWAE